MTNMAARGVASWVGRRGAAKASILEAPGALGIPRRLGSVLLAVAAVCLASRALPTAAQDAADATPAPAATVGECTVPPRPVEEFAALAQASPGAAVSIPLGTPSGTPLPSEGELPADPAAVDAVVETIEQQVACLNAGDLARTTALWTDDYFHRQLGGIPGADRLVAAEPTPVPAADRARLLGVEDIQVLPDGRVSALVKSEGATSLVVLEKSGGRYLIDDGFVLETGGTPSP